MLCCIVYYLIYRKAGDVGKHFSHFFRPKKKTPNLSSAKPDGKETILYIYMLSVVKWISNGNVIHVWTPKKAPVGKPAVLAGLSFS